MPVKHHGKQQYWNIYHNYSQQRYNYQRTGKQSQNETC